MRTVEYSIAIFRVCVCKIKYAIHVKRYTRFSCIGYKVLLQKFLDVKVHLKYQCCKPIISLRLLLERSLIRLILFAYSDGRIDFPFCCKCMLVLRRLEIMYLCTMLKMLYIMLLEIFINYKFSIRVCRKADIAINRFQVFW